MDNREIISELQVFADANGLNIDVGSVIPEMDAGDFITINQAMDNSDNVTIMKVLQKYKARLSESFGTFNSIVPSTRESHNFVKNMGRMELHENYKRFCSGALSDSSHLTTPELQTLVFEDMASTLTPVQAQGRANQIARTNQIGQQATTPNAQTANKLKQNDILQKGNSGHYKVQVPGQDGQPELTDVVGIDVSPNAQQSLVVTKDPQRQGNVKVFGINDVETVKESEDFDEDFIKLLDSIQPLSEGEDLNQEGDLSVLTRPFPDWTDMVDDVTDISRKPESLDGSESVMGNEAMDNRQDYEDIITFCRKRD